MIYVVTVRVNDGAEYRFPFFHRNLADQYAASQRDVPDIVIVSIEEVPEKRDQWIRNHCTDKFEGVPCSYPHCSCLESNKQEMETDYENAQTLYGGA